jgi:hypothetical protein
MFFASLPIVYQGIFDWLAFNDNREVQAITEMAGPLAAGGAGQGGVRAALVGLRGRRRLTVWESSVVLHAPPYMLPDKVVTALESETIEFGCSRRLCIIKLLLLSFQVDTCGPHRNLTRIRFTYELV